MNKKISIALVIFAVIVVQTGEEGSVTGQRISP